MPAKLRSATGQSRIDPIAILLLTGVLVAALWSVLLFEQRRNYEDVRRYAIADAGNVARTFEEHVARTLNNIDAVLRVLRQSWIEDRAQFQNKVRIMQAAYDESLLVQVAVIDAAGKLAYSNLDPNAAPVDLKDREHFRVHYDRDADELFISRPVKGRVSGRYSVQLTRPIITRSDRFGGVLVISLNPSYFSNFFGSLDLGDGGSISLVGLDGVMRARGINRQLDENAIGTELPSDTPFLQPGAATVGVFEAVSAIDGLDRIVSYRLMSDFPMVVSVTKSVDSVFAQHEQLWSGYKLWALVVSCLLLAGGGWLARAVQLQYRFKRRLLSANDSLRTLNNIATQTDAELADKLHKALELGCRHLDVELGLVGALEDQRVVVEKCYPSVAGIKEGDELDLAAVGGMDALSRTDVSVVRHASSSGHADRRRIGSMKYECYIGVPIWVGSELYGSLNFYSATPRVQAFDDNDHEFVRLLGRWIGVSIAEDRAIRELTTRATTDALTGAWSRGYFLPMADEEIDRAGRYRRPLSLVLIDLDHFKRVNDSFGHHAGDQTLCHIARLSREMLRAHDTFARLGGEEFAILMPETAEAAAAAVAERLRARVADESIETLSGRVRITISVGVAQLRAGEEFKALYNRADKALYEAKRQGRDRVETSSDPDRIELHSTCS